MSTGQLLWQPSPERITRTQMYAFMRRVAERHGHAGPLDEVAASWETLRAWSVAAPGDFWREMFDFAGIHAVTPADQTLVGSGMLGSRWFPGLTLNYAQHLLRFDDDAPAIIADDELRRPRMFSRRDLREAVAAAAAGLRSAGVQKGDRVAGYMPNIPETVIAMLATASIGAVWSSCSPDFGVNAVLDRFSQIEPKVLVTVDGYSYGGRGFSIADRIAAIAARLPGLEQVVVVPFLRERDPQDQIERGLTWDDFLAPHGAAELHYEPVPFDHPLFIMYSSGTTGVPKCIVHGHGGTLLQHMKELMLHCDLRAGERIFYFTTCGWMMWNWLVSGLGVGAALVLYEGNPAHPTIHRLWELAEAQRVNVFGTSPKFLSACQKAGLTPGGEQDLAALRCICSTGSPLAAEQFAWVYEHVKRDLQLASISGGTDIISCFMLGNPILPVYAGEIQCRGLGMDVQAWDENQQPVVGEKGELVCCTPFPSQPVGFWNDPDQAKYREAYFDHYADKDVWRHGDFIQITEHGGIIVFGRSDATLNPGGVRIGTAEIYRIVEALPEVLDSIVVGRETADNDVTIVLFVTLREGFELTGELRRTIRDAIAAGASKRHVPREIEQVPAIPHTISGKKVELAVQNVLHGRPAANRDALANPEALEAFKAFAK